MSARKSTQTEVKAALLAMTAEAADIKAAVGGSITDAVADWLAPQYAQAAREQLAAAKGAERLKILRTFVQDWALLQKGGQAAERLRIDWERLLVEQKRLIYVEQDSMGRFKRKTVVGLEALLTYVKHHPKAKAAFDALLEEVRHPWDPSEQGPIGK